MAQGEYVADSLQDYLQRHSEIEQRCTRGGTTQFYTTESVDKFKDSLSLFLRQPVEAHMLTLGE